MSDKTGIEWTDATWNPVTGCTKVSAGCDHCYADGIAKRFAGTPAYPNGFAVTLRPERLEQPSRWRRPRRIFVNSMSDLFHDDVPDDYIAAVFGVMAANRRHTFQILTKRHARQRALMSSPAFHDLVDHAYADRVGLAQAVVSWPLRNVWLGVSVENQQWADIRIPALIGTPAAVRFLSCEPLLGPIDLFGWPDLGCADAGPAVTHEPGVDRIDARTVDPLKALCRHESGIDWVIVGGESGAGARPMHPDWARSLRDQCREHDVPFLFKQWGEYRPFDLGADPIERAQAWSGDKYAPPMIHVGKKAAGRALDGRTWDEYPAQVTA